jgi:beta-phosphoglucomutase-like phosphatase (HAD superfamily)
MACCSTIDAFDARLGAGDVTNTKPDPELYLAALTRAAL